MNNKWLKILQRLWPILVCLLVLGIVVWKTYPDLFRLVLLPVFLGAAGWFGITFIGSPCLEFLSLRKQIHEELTYYANVIYNLPEQPFSDEDKEGILKEWETTSLIFRRLSAKLDAFFSSLSPLHKWLAECFDLNLNQAAGELTGLSNTTGLMAKVKDDSIRIHLRIPRRIDDSTRNKWIEQFSKSHF